MKQSASHSQAVLRRALFRRGAALALLVLALPALYCGLSHMYYRLDRYISTHPGEALVQFSLTEAFVEDGAQLTLETPQRLGAYTELYYTLDGSDPTRESALYTGPITLDSQGQRIGFPVKAALFQGENQSAVYAHTYFPSGTAVLSDNMLVVSLVGEEEDFFGEDGILGLGAPTPEAAAEDPTIPADFSETKRANYYGRGPAWERPVSVEIFDTQGSLLLSQDAGVRVTGSASRDNVQKSLRLYARKEYDPDRGKFSAALFPQKFTSEGSNTPITEYDRLDLRNGGNDWTTTMLGDATMRTLAEAAGFAPVGTPVPAVVYLNGAYYGVAWLQPDYGEKNLAEMCNLAVPENIQTVESHPAAIGEGFVVNEEMPDAVAAYEEMVELALRDLAVEENVRALEQVLDVDNFLLYYALEMYSCNVDWPQNNYKAWRYVSSDSQEQESNPYADGRWRFLFYDLDPAYSTYVDPPDSFDRLLGVTSASPMLASILRNQNYRDRFINLWCILLQGELSPENAWETILSARNILEPELAYREALDPQQTIFNPEYRQILYRKIEDFVNRRPGEIAEKLAQYLQVDIDDRYTMAIDTPDEGGTVYLDGTALPAGSGFTRLFYRDAAVTLRCEPAAGTVLAGWSVNGEFCETQILRLNPEQYAADTLSVYPVLQGSPEAGLLLDTISYRNELNWVTVKNCGTQTLSLSGYALQKNSGETVYLLPETNLNPGESIRILDESSGFTREQLGEYWCVLDLRRGDTLELLDRDSLPVDSVTLPAKNKGYTYGRSAVGNNWVWTPLQEVTG